MAKRKQSKKPRANDAAAVPQQPPSGDAPAPSETEPQVADAEPVTDEAGTPAAPEAAVESSAEVAGEAPAEPAWAAAIREESDPETASPAKPAPVASEVIAADAGGLPADAGAWPEVAEPPPASLTPPDATTEAWAWPEGEEPAPPETAGPPAGEDGEGPASGDGSEPAPDGSRLVSIVESLLFASDKPLGLSDLKRLLGERDGKKVAAAVEELIQQRKGSGVEVATLSNGWALRTPPDNANWVSRLLVGRPIRLSRAMLETLSIVAYRQPVTRPEIDDIRGVDCGPVLKTLLDRGLVRIIGKKEEVGRPMLYGTTPEFLRIFNLRELAELPTLREFYDLTAEDQSRVEAEHGPTTDGESATSPKPDVALRAVARGDLPPEADETDPLIDELDEASKLAKQALGELEPTADAAPADAPAAEGPAVEPTPSESRD